MKRHHTRPMYVEKASAPRTLEEDVVVAVPHNLKAHVDAVLTPTEWAHQSCGRDVPLFECVDFVETPAGTAGFADNKSSGSAHRHAGSWKKPCPGWH